MCWLMELGMSYMAGQWYSWGHWLSVLANGYELCGLASGIPEDIGYLCSQMGMSYVAG